MTTNRARPFTLNRQNVFSLSISSVGSPNVATFIYRYLKDKAVDGLRVEVDFQGAPDAVKSIQFARLIDLLKGDVWMRHLISESEDSEYRLSFENSIVVVFL
jgi:hypothetical protein